MKKINIILLCILGAFMAVSCDDYSETNPVYTEPVDCFSLNTPKYFLGCYDLANTDGIELSWSQPDYGFTAAVTYSYQISADGKFTDESPVLPTTTTSCKSIMSSNELAVAMCEQLAVVSEADVPATDVAVWVRIKAEIPEAPNSVTYSQPLKLQKIKLFYALPDVVLPTAVYMIGSFNEWNWDNSQAMIQVNGAADRFWTIQYLKAGEGFKFNTAKAWDGGQYGFDGVTVNSSAAGALSADGDGNIVVETSGWYIIAIQNVLDGRDILHNLDIFEPNVYVYGAANGGTWEDSDDWKFEVIDDPNAEYPFVSPALLETAGNDDSCLRLCIHPDWSYDWWKTEFIFFDGKIEYRGNGGDQARVGNAAGKVKLNFVTGKAVVE